MALLTRKKTSHRSPPRSLNPVSLHHWIPLLLPVPEIERESRPQLQGESWPFFLVSILIHRPMGSSFVKCLANLICLSSKIDPGDEIDAPTKPNKKQKNTIVERAPSESLSLPGSGSPAIGLATAAIASIEVHTAAIQAAFQDKSANRKELFWALLPHITQAEVEELLVRSKGATEAKQE